MFEDIIIPKERKGWIVFSQFMVDRILRNPEQYNSMFDGIEILSHLTLEDDYKYYLFCEWYKFDRILETDIVNYPLYEIVIRKSCDKDEYEIVKIENKGPFMPMKTKE